MADATGTTVWRWDQQEPFGANPANEDPDANSVAFDLPLRLPGQRYDKETGLHYNYFRDYDPSIGRYGESDPVGLRGGLNTYVYVGAKPLLYSDPQGLWAWWIHKMMTEEALERVKCKGMEPLPLAVSYVDEREFSQTAAYASWHNMRPPWRTPEEGQQDVEDTLRKARASCNLDDLALALHTTQDGTSPSHRGVQVWTGREGFGEKVVHGIPDAFPSSSTWAKTVDASAREIEAFKARCPCVCK